MKVKIGPFKKLGRNAEIVIHNYDVWSLDSTLALIILPALISLKESKSGVPGNFSIVGGESWSQQYSFDFYTETANEAFEIRVQEWEKIIDKMIWSFQEIVEDNYEQKYYYGNAKYEAKKLDSTMLNPVTNQVEELYEMVDTNPNDHWLDIDGLLIHKERIQEGLELFGKYYQDMWT